MPVTESSKTAISHLVAESLTNSVNEVFKGEAVVQNGELPKFKKSYVYMLTISGLNFKVICVLQLDDCELTRRIAGEQTGTDGQLTNDEFFDFYKEMTNGCFGVTKRLLGQSINHLGMSTPYLLSSDVSASSIASDVVDYCCHCTCSIGDSNVFSASLLVTSPDEFNFSFTRSQLHGQEESTGELELF